MAVPNPCCAIRTDCMVRLSRWWIGWFYATYDDETWVLKGTISIGPNICTSPVECMPEYDQSDIHLFTLLLYFLLLCFLRSLLDIMFSNPYQLMPL